MDVLLKYERADGRGGPTAESGLVPEEGKARHVLVTCTHERERERDTGAFTQARIEKE